ncbi:MAG: ATP-binding protein [Clostridia bacterium]|nr:ATP-binding protein [Clostridia bacterium]
MSNKEQLWAAFAARHAEAVWQAEERREQVYRENPVLFQMDQQITEAGSRYCIASLTGGDAEALQAELEALQKKRADFLASIHADLEPHYQCNNCQDTGMGPDGMCECFRRELIAENFRSSNLEQALAHQNFEHFDLSLYSSEARGGLLSPRENMRRIYQLCKNYAEQFDQQTKSLLFVGATGLGKTFLSTAIAKKLLEQGRSVIYISAPELARRLEASRFNDEEGQLQQFFEADMLIIDDLGTESRTAYTVGTLTDLMDQRIRLGKPMLFSTNLNLDGLQKAYDERIVSRLMGHFSYCYFYGDDLRIRSAKEGI